MLAANSALWLGTARSFRQWQRAAKRVAPTQQSLLLKILKNNSETVFGVEHGFKSISTAADYQRSVPLNSYADLQPYIQRIADGESNLLTAENVGMLAPTSGSSAVPKLIPYTASLKSEFQQGVNPWLFATYANWPGLLMGKQYWSITPIGTEATTTSGGIPIGFEEDSEYLSSLTRTILRQVMVVPPAVRRIQDRDNFRYVTLRFLLQCRELSLISIWNPTFLMLVLEPLRSQSAVLLADLAAGTLQPPNAIEPELRLELMPLLKGNPSRARALSSLLDAWNGDTRWRDKRGRSVYEAIWPGLALISCWGDGHAANYVEMLHRMFPNTPIQPKGLLATEGIISFPLGGQVGGALSLNSHFFEFVATQSNNCAGEVKPAHEVELGEVYSVVITTGGGLYRYQLHDLVEVTGFVGQCPMVRFLGKGDSTVDLYGEKLYEFHVRQIVTQELARLRLPPGFWMLAPERDGDYSAHYTLFIQCPPLQEETHLKQSFRDLAARLEEGLNLNYHYKYCRELGQLNSARVFLIGDESGGAYNRFLETCNLLGQRLGDIKPTGLHPYTGWATVFPGRYLTI